MQTNRSNSENLSQGRFRPDRLPSWRDFDPTLRGKRQARRNCEIHAGDNPTAFSVDLRTGYWFCHSCGAKGGDLVDYVMQRDGVDFKEACRRLGCWDDHGTLPKRRRTTKPVQYLVLDFVIDGESHRAEVDDTPRNDRQLTWRIHCDARERLAELRNGTVETVEGETEMQWSILADSWELLNAEDRQ